MKNWIFLPVSSAMRSVTGLYSSSSATVSSVGTIAKVSASGSLHSAAWPVPLKTNALATAAVTAASVRATGLKQRRMDGTW